MKLIIAAIILAAATLIAGCQSDPLTTYKDLSESYTLAVNAEASAFDAGQLSAADIQAIKPYRIAANAAIDRIGIEAKAGSNIDVGEAAKSALLAFSQALVERRTHGPGTTGGGIGRRANTAQAIDR